MCRGAPSSRALFTSPAQGTCVQPRSAARGRFRGTLARVASVRFDRVVMLDFEERDLEREDWDALRELSRELERCRSSDPELRARLAGADCLLVQLGVHVTPALLEAAPHLRYVGVFGTSTGRIDLAGRRAIA